MKGCSGDVLDLRRNRKTGVDNDEKGHERNRVSFSPEKRRRLFGPYKEGVLETKRIISKEGARDRGKGKFETKSRETPFSLPIGGWGWGI